MSSDSTLFGSEEKIKTESTLEAKQGLLHKVRYATEPENTDLILQFIKIQHAYSFGSKEIHRQYLLRQFNLLLEAIKDKSIRKSWRYLCLEYIFIPLEALHKIAECAEGRQFVNMLSQQVDLRSQELYKRP